MTHPRHNEAVETRNQTEGRQKHFLHANSCVPLPRYKPCPLHFSNGGRANQTKKLEERPRRARGSTGEKRIYARSRRRTDPVQDSKARAPQYPLKNPNLPPALAEARPSAHLLLRVAFGTVCLQGLCLSLLRTLPARTVAKRIVRETRVHDRKVLETSGAQKDQPFR